MQYSMRYMKFSSEDDSISISEYDFDLSVHIAFDENPFEWS